MQTTTTNRVRKICIVSNDRVAFSSPFSSPRTDTVELEADLILVSNPTVAAAMTKRPDHGEFQLRDNAGHVEGEGLRRIL